MRWTCKCGAHTLDVEPVEIIVGYVPPIPEKAKSYEWHDAKACLTQEPIPGVVSPETDQ